MYLLVTKGYGLTADDISWSCPSDLKPYVDSYVMDKKQKDESNWLLGMYVQSAVIVAIDHCFNGKKAKSKYMEKPIMQQIEEQQAKENMSEEEKIRYTKQLFDRLKVMQTNFELSKKE